MPQSTVDERFIELADIVNDIAREIRVRGAHSTPVVPLTPTQSQIMRYVHTHPGCSASDIADGSGLQRANVSTALRELRTRGYLISHRDETDGRAIRIHATERADETIARLREAWAGLLAAGWESGAAGGADDLAAVTATLARLRDGLTAEPARKAFPAEAPASAAGGADSIR
ncbi:MarR family transcriptional regulator [Microbacterium fluvii]|uniref:MarR family transcriptional regulator n=1 Tax=Microbacterium fluvii TaxID=415215 RepID=A0ABW2HFZ6_9MICO|nr:MarR family transcriptional regulator [Microbacterium fluvii]MCU4673858.1 MarR family transcriptional regulator [Microbacterium fluvii]